eukprot:1191414-Prorocentrum_minimum.AAC.2
MPPSTSRHPSTHPSPPHARPLRRPQAPAGTPRASQRRPPKGRVASATAASLRTTLGDPPCKRPPSDARARRRHSRPLAGSPRGHSHPLPHCVPPGLSISSGARLPSPSFLASALAGRSPPRPPGPSSALEPHRRERSSSRKKDLSRRVPPSSSPRHARFGVFASSRLLA